MEGVTCSRVQGYLTRLDPQLAGSQVAGPAGSLLMLFTDAHLCLPLTTAQGQPEFSPPMLGWAQRACGLCPAHFPWVQNLLLACSPLSSRVTGQDSWQSLAIPLASESPWGRGKMNAQVQPGWTELQGRGCSSRQSP